ncbi:MAG: hypothetical protein D6734_08880 [Candidatus Schekmanbacteria bacterium]|nr:MAG: hypothetical protein D6734_08880 [Candidatus Schekmanbacteria bacterium]
MAPLPFLILKKEKRTFSVSLIISSLILSSLWSSFFIAITKEKNSNYLNIPKKVEHKIKRVILLTVDTLRYDVISSNGNKKFRTPSIDAIAADSVIFDNAYAPSSWTLPSFASLFTGVSPAVHLTTKLKSQLPSSFTTLAEYMKDDGYSTAAIGCNPILAMKSNNMSKGFVDYNFYPKRSLQNSIGEFILKKYFWNYFVLDASSEKITELSKDWLKKNRKKDFFLWIHYLDPHIPYSPPVKYIKEKEFLDANKRSFNNVVKVRKEPIKISEKERRRIRYLYEAEVRYVDDCIGDLIETLKALKIYRDTLIIFTSDHGEEFWEHNGFEHGHTLYNELIHIPLMIKLPDERITKRIKSSITLSSLFSTILDLCNINYQKNLCIEAPLPLNGNEEDKYNAEIFSSGNLYDEPKESLIRRGYKLIISEKTGIKELYDIIDDPREKFSLTTSYPQKVAELEKLIQKHLAKASIIHKKIEFGEMPSTAEIDADTKKQLKALGYME